MLRSEAHRNHEEHAPHEFWEDLAPERARTTGTLRLNSEFSIQDARHGVLYELAEGSMCASYVCTDLVHSNFFNYTLGIGA